MMSSFTVFVDVGYVTALMQESGRSQYVTSISGCEVNKRRSSSL